jgi:hypothetical protein
MIALNGYIIYPHPYYATDEKKNGIPFLSNDCLILSPLFIQQDNMLYRHYKEVAARAI